MSLRKSLLIMMGAGTHHRPVNQYSWNPPIPVTQGAPSISMRTKKTKKTRTTAVT